MAELNALQQATEEQDFRALQAELQPAPPPPPIEEDSQKADPGLSAALIAEILAQSSPTPTATKIVNWVEQKTADVVVGAEGYTRKAANAIANVEEKFGWKDWAKSTRQGGEGLARAEGRLGEKALGGEHQVANNLGIKDDGFVKSVAMIESGGQSNITATTSSATGSFQFVSQTWLEQVQMHGATHGGKLAWAAQHIHKGPEGYFADKGDLQTILDMRKDNNLSTPIFVDYAHDNKDHLHKILNRDISNTDVYMAHLLGTTGAARFLIAMKNNPNAIAANVMGAGAVHDNEGIFYHKGQAQTLQQVYARYDAHVYHGPTPSDVRVAKNDPNQPPSYDGMKAGHAASVTGAVPNGGVLQVGSVALISGGGTNHAAMVVGFKNGVPIWCSDALQSSFFAYTHDGGKHNLNLDNSTYTIFNPPPGFDTKKAAATMLKNAARDRFGHKKPNAGAFDGRTKNLVDTYQGWCAKAVREGIADGQGHDIRHETDAKYYAASYRDAGWMPVAQGHYRDYYNNLGMTPLSRDLRVASATPAQPHRGDRSMLAVANNVPRPQPGAPDRHNLAVAAATGARTGLTG